MASILKVDKIRVTGSDSDSISFDGSGNITFNKTLTSNVTQLGNTLQTKYSLKRFYTLQPLSSVYLYITAHGVGDWSYRT